MSFFRSAGSFMRDVSEVNHHMQTAKKDIATTVQQAASEVEKELRSVSVDIHSTMSDVTKATEKQPTPPLSNKISKPSEPRV